MSYSTYLLASVATLAFGTPAAPSEPAPALPDLDEVFQPLCQRIRELVARCRREPLSPATTAQFERELQVASRELARLTTQWTFNHLEPDDLQTLPAQVRFEGDWFRRLATKTPQPVSTLFGPIALRRLGYRAAPAVGAPTLFPLARALGLVQGATPALVERVAHYQAESGATQQQTLARLRQEHGVPWGVKRLRQVTAFVAEAAEEHRLEAQVEQVVGWLAEAEASHGRHRPVLSVGRDGITLGVRLTKGWLYEVATTGTITVHDRRGKRRGTVYLAFTPEPTACQRTMSTHLTQLVRDILRRWEGPLPRLHYVTDAGDNETTYYKKVLRRLCHPRTGRKLEWFWVVDYYHASERLWTMADALFGAGQPSWAWARKMQKLLLKPGGVGRVLHSAAALRRRLRPRRQHLQDFQRAYKYLQTRRRHLRYADYRRVGLPIGSGVTEAACKTVYTQRLKLSGMRWTKPGAQTILTLRVVLLSGVWDKVYQRILQTYSTVTVPTPAQPRRCTVANAA
jgi:hypothetical protein